MVLQDTKIVIAGGSAGIGLATVNMLANKGAQVITFGRSLDKLKFAKTLNENIKIAQVDATKRNELDAFFNSISNFNHLVITLTGGKGSGMFKDLKLEDLQEGFNAKVIAHLNTIQSALPYLNKNGSITLVTSVSSKSGVVGTSGLAAINASIDAMIPSLAKELKPLRINAIAPGVINTKYWDYLNPKDKEIVFNKYTDKIPVQRIGNPEEVAHAIDFAINNKYLTGAIIPVDGGLLVS